MLLVADRTELGDLIEAWIDRQRLDKTAVAKMAGMTRQTIYNIQYGASARPDTLRRLVRALATDPRSGELDAVAYLEALTEIFEAAGLAPEPDDAVVLTLKDEVRRRMRDRLAAEKMVTAIDRYPSWTASKRRILLNTLDALNEE